MNKCSVSILYESRADDKHFIHPVASSCTIRHKHNMIRLKDLKAGMPRVGAVVDDRFTLEAVLGSGGGGEVWRVHDAQRDVTCALKFLSSSVDSARTAAFQDEFRLLSTLSHPHLTSVYDFGHDAQFGTYYTSDCVDGQHFGAAVRDASVEETLVLAAQVLRALAYLHGCGVVHADLKPGNILVERAGDGAQVRLIDFGMAVLRDPQGPVGTPSYMAPEIVLGDAPSAASDLYAVGVMLYHAITGHGHFVALDLDDAREKHMRSAAPLPQQLNAACPPALGAWIMQLVAPTPVERTASALQALQSLHMLRPDLVDFEAPAAQQLPPPQHCFVGRRAIFATACALFEPASDARILCCLGAAGMGKSTLCRRVRVAAQLRQHPVVAVDARDARALQRLTQAVAQADPARPMCVIIDNADAIEATHDVAGWQRVCALCVSRAYAVLYAAEAPLDLFQELEASHETKTLEHFDVHDVADFVARQCVLAPPSQAVVVDAIWQHTAGHPAAVSAAIAAVQRTWYAGGGQFVPSDDHMRALAYAITSQSVVPSQEQAAEQRWQSLPASVRELCVYLAHWRGAMPLPILQALDDHHMLMHDLHRAIALGVVQRDSAANTVTFPDVALRQAARATLDSQEGAEVHQRLAGLAQEAQCGARLVDEHWYLAGGDGAEAALLRLCHYDRYHGALQKAIARVRDHLSRIDEPSTAIRLTLARMLVQANEVAEGQQILAPIVAHGAASAEACASWLDAQQLLVRCALRAGDVATAHDVVQSMLSHSSRPQWSSQDEVQVHTLAARCLFAQGDYAQALAKYGQLWRLWEELVPSSEAIPHDVERAQCLVALHRDDEAAEAARAEILRLDANRFPLRVASRSAVLANALRRLGDVDAAHDAYAKAIRYAQRADDVRMLLACLNGQAGLYLQQHDISAARQCFERALSYACRVHDDAGFVSVCTNLARVLAQDGQMQAAEAHIELGLHHIAERGDSLDALSRCPLLHLRGELLRRREDWTPAERALSEAWQLADAHDALAPYRFTILLTRAELARDQGQDAVAQHYLEQAQVYACSDDESAEYAAVEQSVC